MARIEAKPKNCNKVENCEIKNGNKSRTTYDTVVVHLLSYVWLFVIPWTAACHNSMSFTISQSLLKFMSTESVMPSNHLILCPLPLLTSIFPTIGSFLMSPLFASVSQFSHSVVSDSLQPHGLQHTRLPCLSPTPGASSNSCPLHWWCHSSISSSFTPFSCPQSFLASGSFPVSWLFESGGQSIGASALATFLPMNIQGWFPVGMTGLISLLSKGLSRVFSSTIVRKHQFFGTQLSLQSNSHIHTWLLKKP